MNKTMEINKGIEWAYTKLAFMLDYQEVVWPMCDAIKAAGIWTPEELADAVLSGKVNDWHDKRVTKRGLKQVFALLREQMGYDAATLFEAGKLYA